jgi:FlaA1/EpsC-like NDP-sugar epimerase
MTFSNASYKEFFTYVVGRPEYHLLNDSDLQSKFKNSRILITGAGGTIGSALASRLILAKIDNVFLLDHDESALHKLSLNLSHESASHSEKCFIADIRDRQSVKDVIEQVKPTLVVHAAALKHLVMLERFPREGFLTNLVGTLNVAELCAELAVEQFVNISTDKAANPTSILGKTKKLAELITAEIFTDTGLKHCSVRFGNVFASRGSVIETFIYQIKNGISVTITDLQVARFFMSNNEAANLILAAASIQETGTYIQNMGDEVAIKEVVDRIATYFNLSAKMEIIGLKQGEKLHEELFDGPTSSTKFESILLSRYRVKNGLAQDVKANIPLNNAEAREIIDRLSANYSKKTQNY